MGEATEHPVRSRDVLASKPHAAAGMKAVFRLLEQWQVDNTGARNLLGEPSKRTFHNWKAGKVATVPADTMRRIGYLLGIHKALRLLFRNPDNIYRWITRPNDDFARQSPLQRMLGGDVTDLAYVRQYLDAMRSSWA